MGLRKLYARTWKESVPTSGSGTRSLIADRPHGLPPVLQDAARANGIDTATWTAAIAKQRKSKADDGESDLWEVWCDPGMVVWRWGGWGWEEPEFDLFKRSKGELLFVFRS
jgi:hypothetical protein